MKKHFHKVLFWLALACPFIGTVACIATYRPSEPEGFLPAIGQAVGEAAALVMLFVTFYLGAGVLALAALVVSLLRKDRFYIWASSLLVGGLLTEIVLSLVFESYFPLLFRFVEWKLDLQ
jgi:hypothetical protein